MYKLLGLSLVSATTIFASNWYGETIHSSWQQSFEIEEKIYEEKTEEQDLLLFKNRTFGTVLALDGAIQTTEKDEFVYHEMMTHVPILAHGNVKKVLIIGGGDGGALREVVKHKSIEKVVLVEIDEQVITFCKERLPSLSNGAFDDPRVEVVITDGSLFVKNREETFDVILCDSTDPVGPGAVLFTSEFYKDCHELLAPKGIFVNQNGVPFLQIEELSDTYRKRKELFSQVGFYVAAIPTYVGGFMAFGWASDFNYQNISVEELEKRLKNLEGELKYYTPSIHKASFALPKFIEKEIEPMAVSNEHLTEQELLMRLEEAHTQVEVGALYAHYRDLSTRYRVKGLSIIEASQEVAVLYQKESGSEKLQSVVWVRPLSSWLSQVSSENGQVSRFVKVK